MKRFKNILFVLDEDSLGLNGSAEKVAELGRLNDARITLLVGEESTLFNELSLKISGRRDELKAAIQHHYAEKLEQVVARDCWDGVSVTADHDHRANFIGVIRKVLKHGYDLVIKEASLARGIDQLAMRLVRKCPCPVWVMKHDSGQFRRILAAVDVGSDFPETAALNRKIVELAHSLAQRELGEAFYLHSWRLEYDVMLRGPRFSVSPDELFEMKKTLQAERRGKLTALLEANHIHAADQQLLIREGISSEVIAQAVSDLGIDALVMGSVARTGIPGLLIGNSVEKLLGSISCSVLTVKPDGFKSPVTLAEDQ